MMAGSQDGYLTMDILNTANQPSLPDQTSINKPVTTTSGISRELFSVDDLF